jgi:hypothetical protein
MSSDEVASSYLLAMTGRWITHKKNVPDLTPERDQLNQGNLIFNGARLAIFLKDGKVFFGLIRLSG